MNVGKKVGALGRGKGNKKAKGMQKERVKETVRGRVMT